MLALFKKITIHDINEAISKEDIHTILAFVKKNKKSITDDKKTEYQTNLQETTIFQHINKEITDFSFSHFKTYIQFLMKNRIPSKYITVGCISDLLQFCIRKRKLEHVCYLFESKLYSIQPDDWEIWNALLLGYDETEEKTVTFIQLFHSIMNNGGDLNQVFINKPLIISLLKDSPVPLANEMGPYFHTFSKETMKLYKETRLQVLFK